MQPLACSRFCVYLPSTLQEKGPAWLLVDVTVGPTQKQPTVNEV